MFLRCVTYNTNQDGQDLNTELSTLHTTNREAYYLIMKLWTDSR